MRPIRAIHALFASAVLTAALCPPAPAQFGELAGISDSMQREYLNRDLVYFAEMLELDKAQRDILDALYEDYKNDFNDGLAAMQERLKSMKDELGALDKDRIMSVIFVPFLEWGTERKRLGAQFLASVEGILNERQKELLPAFQRRLLREKALEKGILSGESVNLLTVITQMHFKEPTAQALKPLLLEYELALHGALTRRAEVLEGSHDKVIQSLQQQDAAANLRLVDRQLDARIEVRGVNDQFVERLTAALPMPDSAIFNEDAMTRGYPKAYRVTVAQQMFDAAIKLTDLDEETIQAIRDLREVYLGDLASHRQELVDAIRDFEPKRERNKVEMYAARTRGEQVGRLTDPTLEKVRQRDAIDDKYITLLQILLTEEQFLSLPGAERWLRQKEQQEPKRDIRGRDGASKKGAELERSPSRPKPALGGSRSGGRPGRPLGGSDDDDR
jgi:hypothetical protein